MMVKENRCGKRRALRKTCLFLSLFILFAACGSIFDHSHSTDDVLISNFENNERNFIALVKMAQEDSHVVRIANDFTWLDTDYHWPRTESEIGFSKERWDKYRSMFSQLGLKEGIAWSSDGSILLIASTKGMMTDGSAKGYAFSTKPLSPTFDSLESINQQIHSGKITPGVPVYRKIKENWYVYYEGD